MIIRERPDLRSQHDKAVARRRASKIHEPRFVNPQMMNPVNEDHAGRMSNPARQIQPCSHWALLCNGCDLICIDGMPFKTHEKTDALGSRN